MVVLATRHFATEMVMHLAPTELVPAPARKGLLGFVVDSVLQHIKAFQLVEKAALVLQIVVAVGLPVV
jgi:hypothetical protein